MAHPPALRQPLPSRVVGDADPYAVGADSISARKACHCRRRPRATIGRPYKTKSSPCTFMQDELWLGRRGSNSRMRESKSRALPLGDDPL